MSAHDDNDRGPCGDCTVVHHDFGKSARPAPPTDPLSDAEIRGLREVFRRCPIAMRALERAS